MSDREVTVTTKSTKEGEDAATTTELMTQTTSSTTTAKPTQDDPRAARLASGVDSFDYDGYFGLWEDLVPFAGELGLSGDRRGDRYIVGYRPLGH